MNIDERAVFVQSHDADEDEELNDSEEQEDGADKMSVSALASSSAAFWQRMLKQRWERMQQEEEEAAVEANARSLDGEDGDASGVLHASNISAAPTESEDPAKGARSVHSCGGQLTGPCADRENGFGAASEKEMAMRADHGNRASDSQGSELAAPEQSESRGTRAVRQTRARRAPKRRYEDDSPPPPAAPVSANVHLTATSRAREEEDALASGGAPGKRNRASNMASAAQQLSAQAPAAVTTTLGEFQAPQQVLINLRTQFENIMKALKDPGSLVNCIFLRAQQRIRAMVSDAGLNLAVEKDRAVFNFALQVNSK
jgi:hypothetical protein